MTVIHLVRHGRTALNANGRLRGLEDPPLDARGRIEAEAAAAALSGVRLDALYTSPLLRAVETANAIARSTGLTPSILVSAIDLDLGRWQGLTPDEARAVEPLAFERFRSRPRDAVAPGGEALRDVELRMRRSLDALAAAGREGSAAVVSHEIPIRLLLANVADLRDAEMWRPDLPTGAIVTLRRRAGRWSADETVTSAGGGSP